MIRKCAFTLSLCALLSFASRSSDWNEDMIIVAMRQIGHKVLLSSGDSTSLILPVEKQSADAYILKFGSPFSFHPKVLVEIIHQQLQENNLPLDYIIKVFDTRSNKVVYSYRVGGDIHLGEVACLPRKQPVGYYSLLIRLKHKKPAVTSSLPLLKLAWLPFLAFLLFAFLKFYKKPASTPSPEAVVDHDTVRVGKFIFNLNKQILSLNNERIDLSAKESQLLKIFITHPNEIMDRDKLLKEVWEDEGVFVGRSLDVFVSRLRKKLLADPSLRIVNIHGKGYKLEVTG